MSPSTLSAGGRSYEIFRLEGAERLPYTLRILLENALRHGEEEDAEALRRWQPAAAPSDEISFRPARVLLQDFTGVPAVVDLAGMRNAMADLGGDPSRINPQLPAELVIDHSVQVDEYGSARAMFRNAELEFERNRERYAFLRWGQTAFDNFKVVPPNTGIVHQVNLEFLARVIEARDGQAFPDTLVGTDSHTTMINGLGVLGWGVGGIEAEAAMLGEAVSMLIPEVVGFKLIGSMPEGATATDLVLTVTQLLRAAGVVGKFVEYFGHGLVGLPLADRATIGNMSPEYGATCGFFPVDDETLKYLRLTGRDDERLALVEAYCKENALWHDPDHSPEYSQVVELDLSTVEPSLAGPRRPQDRVPLRNAKRLFLDSLETFGVDYGNGHDEAVAESFPASDPPSTIEPGHGELVPGVQVDGGGVAVAPRPVSARGGGGGRGVQARARVGRDRRDHILHQHLESASDDRRRLAGAERGRARHAAQAVGEVQPRAGLEGRDGVLRPGGADQVSRRARVPDRRLRLHDVHRELRPAAGVDLGGDRSSATSSSARCCRGIATSRLGSIRRSRPTTSPRRRSSLRTRSPAAWTSIFSTSRSARIRTATTSILRDLWPSAEEIQETITRAVRGEMFSRTYADVFTGDPAWRELPVPEGDLFAWEPDSTYVRRPPYFEGMSREPGTVEDVTGARCLVMVGDSVTTDHISPAGAIKPDAPAGKYLVEHGVERKDFNSYGSRRGNHEVMVRGTFANVRLRNLLVPGSEGTWTVHVPSGEEMTIYDASTRYLAEGTPLVVIAGKEYGSGSSRDWAAKGPNLLGVRAVIAESYERIHRSNLLMMGILPLQFLEGETPATLGLTGREEFSVEGVDNGNADEVTVRADDKEFRARVRLDTPREREYLRHGGILQYVLRRLLSS